MQRFCKIWETITLLEEEENHGAELLAMQQDQPKIVGQNKDAGKFKK